MITKIIDEVSFQLKEDFDFGFLAEYGTAFKVFDKQDSGYICFGVVDHNGKKQFLKVAGAATLESNKSREEAIQRLQSTITVYEHLHHPNLLDLKEHKPIKEGYVTVFEWFEGECMGKQYNAVDRFLSLPLDEKQAIFHDIVKFHIHTNECGYIALDFYDGSIMYDFSEKVTRICDIECYEKKPVTNTMGRMWGSSRFMSPEEFERGAEIDERSNVFLMGATAFQLFGGGKERSFEKWEASEKKYQVALKAVHVNKADRYQTIGEFFEAWTESD